MDRNEAIKVIKHNWPEGRHQLSEALKTLIPELNMSDDEQIRKSIIGFLKTVASLKDGKTVSNEDFDSAALFEWADWLEKQGEPRVDMVQWKGDNLREVLEFTGKNKNFDKWFTSFEEFEKYVHEHNDIFKIFNEDGSHYEVPVGAWIVKTPDGYNVPSKAKYKQKIEQKPADKIEPKFKIGDTIVEKDLDECGCGTIANIKDGKYIFDDGFFIRIKEQDLWQLVEQKPACGEEDKQRIEGIIATLMGCITILSNYGNPVTEDTIASLIDDIHWLKSLKERYTWKPSDEQIEVLNWCKPLWNEPKTKAVLESLIEDLKKLKGE